MLQPNLCSLTFVVFITYVKCDTQLQGQVTLPSAAHVASSVGNGVAGAANAVGNAAGNTVNAVGNVAGGAVNTVGNVAGGAVNTVGNVAGSTVNAVGNGVQNVGQWAGNTVNQAGNVLASGVSGAGNLAGNGIRAVGNAAGNGINNVGYYAGQGANAVGQGASNVVGGAGNLAGSAAGNAGTYVFTQGGAVLGQAGQSMGNLAQVPLAASGTAYTALQNRMTQVQVQMAVYKQSLLTEYNTSSLQYMYMSNMLDNIAIVDLGPYVDSLNYGLAPYGQMVNIYRTNPGNQQSFTFPTIIDASGNANSLPNGLSLQQGNIVNARGNTVGGVPQYMPSNNGAVLNDPNGNQYTLGPDIYLDQYGNLRFRRNNQPWAIAGQYVIDLGGNVFDSGGNIIGNLCRCINISGSFGPQGTITLN